MTEGGIHVLCSCHSSFVLLHVMLQDDMVDQVPDVHRSWIKKLIGFTVLKPTERSITTLHTKMLLLVELVYVPCK